MREQPTPLGIATLAMLFSTDSQAFQIPAHFGVARNVAHQHLSRLVLLTPAVPVRNAVKFLITSSVSTTIPTIGNVQIAEHACTATSLSIWDAEVIAEYAFAGCARLTSVSIPNDTKCIEAHAFDGCTRLRSVSIWDDETMIDATAFSNCPNIED